MRADSWACRPTRGRGPIASGTAGPTWARFTSGRGASARAFPRRAWERGAKLHLRRKAVERDGDQALLRLADGGELGRAARDFVDHDQRRGAPAPARRVLPQSFANVLRN